MTASRNPPENNPFAAALRFHVEEAIAAGATVAVLIWENSAGGIGCATVPQSKAVARGLIDYAQEALLGGEAETEEEED